MVQFLKLQSMVIKRILKINSSWPELLNFQNSFNCHWLDFLRTAPLSIHEVIIIAVFRDGMNAIYLYFVKNTFLVDRYLDFKDQIWYLAIFGHESHLTLNHTIPSFNDLWTRRFFKNILGKEKKNASFSLPTEKLTSIFESLLFCRLQVPV